MTTTLTFDQWLKLNPDLKPQVVVCDLCCGTGFYQCECGDVHDCKQCNATGEYQIVSLKDLYDADVFETKMKLKAFLGA